MVMIAVILFKGSSATDIYDYTKSKALNAFIEILIGIVLFLIGIRFIEMPFTIRKSKLIVYSDHIDAIIYKPVFVIIKKEFFSTRYDEINGCRVDGKKVILTTSVNGVELLQKSQRQADKICTVIRDKM